MKKPLLLIALILIVGMAVVLPTAAQMLVTPACAMPATVNVSVELSGKPFPAYVIAGDTVPTLLVAYWITQRVGDPLSPQLYNMLLDGTEFKLEARWNNQPGEWQLTLFQDCLGNMRADQEPKPAAGEPAPTEPITQRARGCKPIALAAFYISRQGVRTLCEGQSSADIDWKSPEVSDLLYRFYTSLCHSSGIQFKYPQKSTISLTP